MKQEDKDLLFKDLCARIPYKVIITDGLHTIPFNPKSVQDGINACQLLIDSGNIFPYLRPMSSMTEEEINEFILISDTVFWLGNKRSTCILSLEQMDWLNKHHFDYRGLIEKGLALEAKEGMYNIK